MIRPALGEQRPKLGPRPWPFLDEDAHRRDERIGVDALDRAAERTARPEHPLDDGLHERTQRRHVACRHQMDRGAHQRCPDHLPAHEQVGQLRGVEPVHTRPEADVRIHRHLCLHPDEPFDRLGRGELLSFAVRASFSTSTRAVDRPCARGTGEPHSAGDDLVSQVFPCPPIDPHAAPWYPIPTAVTRRPKDDRPKTGEVIGSRRRTSEYAKAPQCRYWSASTPTGSTERGGFPCRSCFAITTTPGAVLRASMSILRQSWRRLRAVTRNA